MREEVAAIASHTHERANEQHLADELPHGASLPPVSKLVLSRSGPRAICNPWFSGKLLVPKRSVKTHHVRLTNSLESCRKLRVFNSGRGCHTEHSPFAGNRRHCACPAHTFLKSPPFE